MSKMKYSGIDWIGIIPDKWKINRLRYNCKFKTGGTPSDKEGINSCNDGYPWITAQDMNDGLYINNFSLYINKEIVKEYRYKLFPRNSILLVCIASVGKIGYISKECYSNQQITAIMPNENVESKYLLYFIKSMTPMIVKDASSNVVPIINTQYLANIPCCIPYLQEQKLIANFLDEKVNKIDVILNKLNNQIEILNNYKRSLITEKVTKGINKNIKMKESNIQWIGNIPYHWNVRRIKHSFIDDKFGIKVGPFGSSLTECVVGLDNGDYKIYGQANLIRRDFEYGDNYISKTDFFRLKNYEVISGDIVVSMMGTIGKCRVVPVGIKQGIMDSHLIKIRLNKKIMNPKYFEYQYEGNNIYEQLLYNSNGSIMNGLNSTIVKNVYFVYPPLDEQNEIVEYLDKKCSKIDNIIENKKKQIEKMEQYKKSVIYEYVTGKKRIKGAEDLYE